jgi:hypothetical protein
LPFFFFYVKKPGVFDRTALFKNSAALLKKVRKSQGCVFGIWKSMEVYGNLWKSMEVYGSLWKSMEVYGSLWKSMGFWHAFFKKRLKAFKSV